MKVEQRKNLEWINLHNGGNHIKSRMKKISVLFFVLLLIFFGIKESFATLYCDRSYSELKVNSGEPYNAVGLLNNGCTAFLIDKDHILAAAHCFTDVDNSGEWQRPPNSNSIPGDLRFYINFHPDRVSKDAKRVPRAEVKRIVVGSRVAASLGDGYDWGIAKIGKFEDAAGLDLTPIQLYRSAPTKGMVLINPAYTRHHFPHNDADSMKWDNMNWDKSKCDWVKPDFGLWTILMHEAPIYNGIDRDTVGCNSRWGAGMIHANCSVKDVSNNVVIHNCDTAGGSSGSPVLYLDSTGKWKVIAVGHGGGGNNFESHYTPGPACSSDKRQNWNNDGASVERFRNAPRFASNIAVHRSPFNASGTAVFAVDSDLDQVLWRVRQGNSPKYDDTFSFWQNMGTPYSGAKLTRIAACSEYGSQKPQVVVIAGNKIYSRSTLSSGNWGSWLYIAPPTTTTTFVDIDAVSHENGRCQLFAVASSGSVYTVTNDSANHWSNWNSVASGSFKKVTALKYSGTTYVAMIDAYRQIWRTSPGRSGWKTPTKLNNPSGVVAWNDIDMTWDEAGRGFMLGVNYYGGNNLYFMPIYGEHPWTEWRYFETHLWAPNADYSQDAPKLLSITASRWMEDRGDVTSPVIFATDDYGNVYFIEYTHNGTPRWILDWKSFYHEKIVY